MVFIVKSPRCGTIVLTAQDQPAIEHFIRRQEGGWLSVESRALNETVEIGGLGSGGVIGMQMREIYRGVTSEPRGTAAGLLASPAGQHGPPPDQTSSAALRSPGRGPRS